MSLSWKECSTGEEGGVASFTLDGKTLHVPLFNHKHFIIIKNYVDKIKEGDKNLVSDK